MGSGARPYSGPPVGSADMRLSIKGNIVFSRDHNVADRRLWILDIGYSWALRHKIVLRIHNTEYTLVDGCIRTRLAQEWDPKCAYLISYRTTLQVIMVLERMMIVM